MNNVLKKASLIPVLTLGFLLGAAANAQVDTIGYSLSANGVKVDVSIAEVTSEQERNASIEGLSAEIQKERVSNPESFFEMGWLDVESNGREPAQSIFSKSRTFLNDLFQKLKSKNIDADRVAGIKVPAEKIKKDSWYLNHSRLTWVFIRVANSTGFKLGSLVFSGLSLQHSVEISAAIAAACTLTAYFYMPINTFSNKARFYHRMNLDKNSKLARLLNDPKTAARIDKIHGKFNWGLVEVAFGGILIGGENLIRKVLNLPLDLPSIWGYAGSTGLAIMTQQVWDRAVEKYKDLQNLLQEQSGGSLEDPMFIKQRNANVLKRGALGSILSVVGFTWANSSNLIIKWSGYGVLGSLGAMGYVYERRIEAKLAKALSNVNTCNVFLGGDLPELDEAG